MSAPEAGTGPRPADGVIVIRLWREEHDPRTRARLLPGTTDTDEWGDPLIGLEAIVAAVIARIRAFEEQAE